MAQLYTPHGVVNLDRQEYPLPTEYMKALADFADDSATLGLGIHCARCKQDIRGANSGADAMWKLECGCRTFVGRNIGGR